LGEGGGGPEYPDALSGRGDKDRVPVLEPVVRIALGGARSSFSQHFCDVIKSSFLEYLAELDRTNPEVERTGDRDGDRVAAGLLIWIWREEVERVTKRGGVILPSILLFISLTYLVFTQKSLFAIDGYFTPFVAILLIKFKLITIN
jgi:hypothetical protein